MLSMSNGLRLFDFGTGRLVVGSPPSEEVDTSWNLGPVVNRDDRDSIREAVREYVMAFGGVPDKVSYSDLVSRDDLRDAFAAVFDLGDEFDWAYVQTKVAPREGDFPIATEDDRSRLLDAWLDMIVQG